MEEDSLLSDDTTMTVSCDSDLEFNVIAACLFVKKYVPSSRAVYTCIQSCAFGWVPNGRPWAAHQNTHKTHLPNSMGNQFSIFPWLG